LLHGRLLNVRVTERFPLVEVGLSAVSGDVDEDAAPDDPLLRDGMLAFSILPVVVSAEYPFQI